MEQIQRLVDQDLTSTCFSLEVGNGIQSVMAHALCPPRLEK